MANNIHKMDIDRKNGILTLIRWYWNDAVEERLITKSDFDFLYSLWESGISIYADDVQHRLNTIRDVYNKNKSIKK